jgi:hypothetical protein
MRRFYSISSLYSLAFQIRAKIIFVGKLLTPNWGQVLQNALNFHLFCNTFLYCMGKSWGNQLSFFRVHKRLGEKKIIY